MNELKSLLRQDGIFLLALALLLFVLFEYKAHARRKPAHPDPVTAQAADQSNGLGDFNNPNMKAQ